MKLSDYIYNVIVQNESIYSLIYPENQYNNNIHDVDLVDVIYRTDILGVAYIDIVTSETQQ